MDDVPAADRAGDTVPARADTVGPVPADTDAPVRADTVGRLLRDRLTALSSVAAGGAVGSLTRWGLGLALGPSPGESPAFPWATFTANVTGCLLLGLLTTVLADRRPTSPHLRLFLGVGVLGGYTTFSTLMLETRGLLVSGRVGAALLYMGVSVVVGLAAVVGGMRLARRLPGGRAAETS